MNHSDLTLLLRTAGAEIYQDRRSDALSRAVDCLTGRTHFVDEGTRKYFGSRILSCQLVFSGAFLRLTESVFATADKSNRVCRVVLFDVFGTVVWRPDLNDSKTSSAAAEKQFWAWFEAFDPAAHYAPVLAERAERLARESVAFKKAARAANRLQVK